ncbi:MAG: hypothetical protein ACLFUJ_00185 [Phycisphaerae bacterium]
MSLSKILLSAFAAALVVGCVGQPYPAPPRTVRQLQADQRRRAGGYPAHTVLLHNAQRVLDPALPTAGRVESVEVLKAMTVNQREILAQLASLLEDEKTPDPLRKAVLDLLISQDYPGLAGHIVNILPKLDPSGPMRKNLLDWLARHGEPSVLAEVVQAWARQEGPDSPAEQGYRNLVARLSKISWDEALLGAINDEGFLAKGSALEILADRIHPSQLAGRIRRLPSRTQAVAAMQAFDKMFDYLPHTAEQLLAVAQLHLSHRAAMDDARKLYLKWKQRDGYQFAIEDFHLLAHLATDPLRPDAPRDQVLLSLGQATRGRKHVSHLPDSRGKEVENNFWQDAEGLSTAEVWTLYLLNELLSNPVNQAQLYLTARDDWRDKQQVYGGLIRYVHGRAATRDVRRGSAGGAIAYRYPNQPDARNNAIYVPDSQAQRDARDSLCWYFPNFQEMNNAHRAGPDKSLLETARQHGRRGLVVTSLNGQRFSAHYFTLDGKVISLGVLPFRR